MAIFLPQFSLAAGSLAMVWWMAKELHQARRIYKFHDEFESHKSADHQVTI